MAIIIASCMHSSVNCMPVWPIAQTHALLNQLCLIHVHVHQRIYTHSVHCEYLNISNLCYSSNNYWILKYKVLFMFANNWLYITPEIL